MKCNKRIVSPTPSHDVMLSFRISTASTIFYFAFKLNSYVIKMVFITQTTYFPYDIAMSIFQKGTLVKIFYYPYFGTIISAFFSDNRWDITDFTLDF